MIKDADFVVLFIAQLTFYKLLWFSCDEAVLTELRFADKAEIIFIINLFSLNKL